VGGDLKATPHKDDARSHYPSLSQFCENTGLTHITLKDIYIFIPSKTNMDLWLLRQSHTPQHYTIYNTYTTTYIPEYGDHKALILDLAQISAIQLHNAKRNLPNPTTHSHLPFILLPIPQNIAKLYRMGTTSTKANTQRTTQTTIPLLHDDTANADHIDYVAPQVMTINHE
jgi:hypothetical protein